jgi:hypothetical protein
MFGKDFNFPSDIFSEWSAHFESLLADKVSTTVKGPLLKLL